MGATTARIGGTAGGRGRWDRRGQRGDGLGSLARRGAGGGWGRWWVGTAARGAGGGQRDAASAAVGPGGRPAAGRRMDQGQEIEGGMSQSGSPPSVFCCLVPVWVPRASAAQKIRESNFGSGSGRKNRISMRFTPTCRTTARIRRPVLPTSTCKHRIHLSPKSPRFFHSRS